MQYNTYVRNINLSKNSIKTENFKNSFIKTNLYKYLRHMYKHNV